MNVPAMLEKAMNLFGPDPQFRMAAEELAEAGVAVLHAVRGRIPWDDDTVAEELADVSIVLDQLQFVPGLAKKFAYYKELKLERLKDKLEEKGVRIE